MNLKICPNLSLPEAKALINKIGLFGFYKLYIQNNYSIPSMESVEKIPNIVDGLPKVVDVFNKNQSKLNQWFNNKAIDRDSFWKKFQELGVPKDQLGLLRNTEGESLDEIILNFIANYSYSIEINTAKSDTYKSGYFAQESVYGEWSVYDAQGNVVESELTQGEAIRRAKHYNEDDSVNTQHYFDLTVPGGTNYTENEIATPAITPSIKGHAQFATANGIGWFRSDVKTMEGTFSKETKLDDINIEDIPNEFQLGKTRFYLQNNEWYMQNEDSTTRMREVGLGEPEVLIAYKSMLLGLTEIDNNLTGENYRVQNNTFGTLTKTRRILEVQSDLFQKGRDKEQLIGIDFDLQGVGYTFGSRHQYQIIDEFNNEITFKDTETGEVYKKPKEWLKEQNKKAQLNKPENQFLQLLNKDNNWATFFIKSIIQDSANKGYEKVLFPRLDTIIQIESANNFKTYEEAEKYYKAPEWIKKNDEAKKKLDNKRQELKDFKSKKLSEIEEEYKQEYISKIEREIAELYEAWHSLQPPLLNTAKFYENDLANRLDDIAGGNKNNRAKGIWALNQITDEYGNTWNEVPINKSRDNNTIYYDIEDNTETQSVANLLFVNRDKFNAYQQQEIIKSILRKIQEYRNKGTDNVKTIIASIKEDLIATEEYFRNPDDFEANEETEQIADNIKAVIDNYNKFIIQVNKQLESIGLSVNTENRSINEENNEEDSVYDSVEALLQKLNYSDESSFAQSSKDNASGDIKLALSLIPKYVYENGKLLLDEDGKPVEELNQINRPKYEDLDVIWKDLLYTLVDIPIGEKLDYLKTSVNPKHQVIYNAIVNNPKINIQNEFESVFSKQQTNFVTSNIKKEDKDGNKTISVFDTNRSNAASFIIDNWYENFLQSEFVKLDKEGNLQVNTELGKQANEIFKANLATIKSNPEESKKNILNLLSALGITISPKIYDASIRVNSENITFESLIKSKLKHFFNKLSGETIEQDFEEGLEYNNPFITETDGITLLAKLEDRANPSIHEDSFISGDGKAKYSFVNNSYLSHKVRQLLTDNNYLDKLATVQYTATSYWLKGLRNDIDTTFKDNFKVEYLDTLGNQKTNQVNKPFKRMSTREKEFIRVAFFQNQGRGTSAKEKLTNIGKFIGLIPSDKTTIPVYTTIKVPVQMGADYTFNPEVTEVMYDQFLAEYNRVRETFKQLNDDNVQKISEYHTGAKLGTKFIVFPMFNNILIENGELLELDTTRIEQLVKPELEKFLANLVKDQLSYWHNLRLDSNVLFDKSYSANKGFGKNIDDNLRNLAADYAVNNFIFFMNQTQMISGDPALHGKSVWADKKKGIVEVSKSIDKTWINYYKRMAKDIAPGLDGNFENTEFTTIFLQDLKYDTDHLNEYNEKIGEIAQAYTGMNPADAQEYTTLEEHLRVMDAYGRLTQEKREAGERLLQGGNDIGDILLILQPMKPVYVTDKIEDNIDKFYYIKTSSFPLIPALTEGLEIDKLRRTMEANGIDRAVYESGVKLGLQGKLSTISNDGFVEFNILNITEDQKIKLNRSGFRIQQELPYHGEEDMVLEGSQARKLLFVDLEDGDVITYNGKSITAKEAKQLYEDLHIEKYNRAFDQFMKEIGYDSTTGKIKDLSKIEKLLRDEAESRNYSINDIYSIQVINDNGKKRFKVPLAFTNNSQRFESILNSLVTNRVIKQELPGFARVQGSGAGFSKVVGYDEANSVIKSGIIWLDKNDTKLNYIREKDGKLVAADILLPSWFKDNKGNFLDLKKFVKEDGTLDTNKLPEDLLTTIGIRIPTQGYGSIMTFKVKGFLPQYVGDLAIVPSEITVQMGSDFDVDKLFMYRYEYNYNKGVLSKVDPTIDNLSEASKKQINNAIIQFFEDRYSDPKMLAQILEPNGFGKLPEVASKVASLQKGNKSIHTFTTKDQNNIHKVNNDGKAGTAIFSLFSTFNRSAQDAKLRLKFPFRFKNSKNQVVELQNLYEVNNIEGGRKSSTILYLQSAAVDNSKEQILGKLNVNDQTMGVAGTMAMLGLDEEFIGYFLSQPILREYVEGLSEISDIIDVNYDPTAKPKLFNRLLNKYNSQQFSPDQLYVLTEDIHYGIKELLASLENNISEETVTFNTPEELNVIQNVKNILQLKVLLDFDRLSETASVIQTLQSIINTDIKGLGASFTALSNKATQIQNVLRASQSSSYPIDNVIRLFSDNVVGKATDILLATRRIYGNVLSQGTVAYDYVVQKIFEASDISPTDNNLGDIYKNIKSFILSSEEIIPNISEERRRLLFGKDSLAKRWDKYSKTAEGKRNLLTQRIKVKIGKRKNDPDLLTALNTPASNSTVDINNAMMYFYDMLISTNTEEATLAEDLVKYFLITGAQYGSNSIGKYISYDALEKYDFSAKLRSIEDRLGNPEILEGFIDQYFQNNPSKAKSIEMSYYPEVITFSIDNASPLINANGNAVKYISSYNSDKFEFVLYKRIRVESDKYVFQKIPVLVNDKLNIKYYNFTELKTSSAVEEKPKIDIPVRAQISTTNTLKEDYEFNNGVESVLKSIIENTSNEYFRKIAIDLLSKGLTNVNLTEGSDRAANGWYDNDNNTVYINFESINKYIGLENSKFEEVFLHELLHAGTVSKLDKYNNLRQSLTSKQILDEGFMTREEIIAANNINKLFEEYRKQYPDQDKLNKFIDINTRRLNDKISAEELQFLKDNKNELYPLFSVQEFVAAGLTNPNFVNTLKSNNLWSKLVKFISDLLGINSTDLDALYNSTINLIDTTQDNTIQENPNDDILEDITDDIKEYNRKAYLAQRDEFLRAYRVPKVNNGYGYDPHRKLSEKAKKGYLTANSNPKYDRIRIEFVNDELRIRRVDPITIFDDISDNPITEEEKFIKRVIDKYSENLKKIRERIQELGDKAPAELSVRAQKIVDKINELTEKNSISLTISTIEQKVNSIKEALNSTDFDSNDLYEFKSYLNMLSSINQQIEFDEDYKDLEVRLNNVSAEAIKVNKILSVKSVELIQSYVNSKINFEIPLQLKNELDKGLIDVGKIESGLLDYGESSSAIIQSIGRLIDMARFEANQKHDTFIEEFNPIVKDFLAVHKNYDILLRKDSNGKPTGHLVNKYKDEFYQKSRKNFPFFSSNTVIDYTETGRQEFEEDKKIAYENLHEEDYLTWLRLNSPESFITDWKNGKNPQARGAEKYLNIEPIDKWIDPSYTALMSLGENDPAVKMYNYIEPIIRKLNKKYKQQANYIPEIHKSVADYLAESNLKGGLGHLRDSLIESFTVELVNTNTTIDEYTGEIIHSIPVAMFSNNLSAQDKSYDLARIVEAAQYQEYTLTAKREIEPLLNIYYGVLKDAKSIVTKPGDDGEIVVDKPAQNMLDQSNFMIQSFLYNKTAEIEGVSNRKIKGRNIAASKATDAIINYVRIKGMAFNPFSAIGNIMQGLTSNFIYGAGGEYFNISDQFKAFGLMLHSLGGRSQDAKKTAKFMRKFDVFTKANDLKYGTSRDLKATTNTWTNISWFELQERGEYFIQGQTLLSILIHDGYYDKFDENGKWIGEGENPFDDPKFLYNYTQKIRSAIIDVHGNYVREIQNKKHFYWRAAMIFRTWLPQAVRVRFGAESVDTLSGRVKKGRYRTVLSGDFFRNADGQIDLQATKENILWLAGISKHTTLSDLDKINMRKNLAELALIGVITMLILGLKAALEDFDDDDKNYTTYLLNSLSRTQNDLTFFMLPSSFDTMMKDPWPIMGVLTDQIQLLEASFATITGDPVYKTGPRKDQSRFYKELADNFPIINQIDKNLVYARDVMDD